MDDIPPCLIKERINIVNNHDVICLSDKKICISHDVPFNYSSDLHKLFKKSPYISKSCKNCSYFIKSRCRGLLNEHFEKIKKGIVARHGEDIYNAIKSDYKNGVLVYGSSCVCDCLFCQKKDLIIYYKKFLV